MNGTVSPILKLVVRRDWYFGKTGIDNGSNEGSPLFSLKGTNATIKQNSHVRLFISAKYPSRLTTNLDDEPLQCHVAGKVQFPSDHKS